jgi:predicted transport protein
MPKFVRDVSTIGHWGTGDIDMSISNEEQLEQAFDLIRAAHLKTGS